MKFWPAVPPAILLATLLAIAAPAEVIERVYVRVGGDILTMSEFTNRQIAAAQAARIAPDKVDAFLRENNNKILQDAIDEILLVQRAADLGLRLRAEYVDEVIEGIKKDNKIENEDDFNARLRSEGLTLTDLKRNIERSILRQQVIRKEIDPKITVADADARADYERRKTDYTKPATVHLQELLISGVTPQSLARAKEAVTAARGSQPFEELAKRSSASPTASIGGDLGEVPTADLAPALAREASKLKDGEVSEPFVDGGGYRVVKVVARKAEVVTPFDEARQDVINQLMRPKYEDEYEKYMVGLREIAKPETQIMVREVNTDVTISGEGSLLSGTEGQLSAPGEASKPAAPADPDAEISTTPQTAPQRVAPPSAATPAPASPAAPAVAPAQPRPTPTPAPPKPTPKPSPTPTPSPRT